MHLDKSTRIAFFAGVLVVLLGGTAFGLPKSGYIVEEQVTSSDGETTRAITRFTFKGNKSRYDVTVDVKESIVVITNGSLSLVYDPKLKQAYKTDANKGAPKTLQGRINKDAQLVRGLKKTGTETILGKKCSIYIEQSNAGAVTKWWLSTDPKLPIILRRVTVIPGPDPGNPATVTTRVVEARMDTPVKDTLFQLPKGTRMVPPPVQEPKVHEPPKKK